MRASADPPPDAFAVVMATGIVSVAAYDQRYWRLGIALSILAVIAFAVLALGFLVWVLTRPTRVVVLTRDPDVTLRLFTVVAACGVLGVRWGDHVAVVSLLGGLALVGWIVLAVPAVAGIRSRPSTELCEQACGAWLLPSVASAGLASTASILAIHLRVPPLLMVAVAAWVVGMVIYLAVSGLILWRALAVPFGPAEVTPDSWILMGALAITALAGDHVLAAVHALRAPAWLAGAAPAVTLGAWVIASLWIPVLLSAEMWRATAVAGSLRYQRVRWAAVFPLGMYSAASAATAIQLHLRSLDTISLVFFWIALAAWALVGTGALRSALKSRVYL